MNLIEKMRAIRNELVIVKDAVNPHFKNEYASLGSVLDALNPLLEKHNLHMEQGPDIHHSGVPCIKTRIYDMDFQAIQPSKFEPFGVVRGVADGEYVEWSWPIPISDNPQKTASGSSYGRRYSLLCGFALLAEDDDAEHTLGRGEGRQVPKGVSAALKRLGK